MINLLMVGLLLGMSLGCFFRVYALLPGCALAVVLALSGPSAFSISLIDSVIALALILSAVQVGYVSALLIGRRPTLLPNRRTLRARHS